MFFKRATKVIKFMNRTFLEWLDVNKQNLKDFIPSERSLAVIEYDGESFSVVCYICSGETDEEWVCEVCDQYYCESCSSTYNQFSQIDYNCCKQCQEVKENR